MVDYISENEGDDDAIRVRGSLSGSRPSFYILLLRLPGGLRRADEMRLDKIWKKLDHPSYRTRPLNLRPI